MHNRPPVLSVSRINRETKVLSVSRVNGATGQADARNPSVDWSPQLHPDPRRGGTAASCRAQQLQCTAPVLLLYCRQGVVRGSTGAILWRRRCLCRLLPQCRSAADQRVGGVRCACVLPTGRQYRGQYCRGNATAALGYCCSSKERMCCARRRCTPVVKCCRPQGGGGQGEVCSSEGDRL